MSTVGYSTSYYR